MTSYLLNKDYAKVAVQYVLPAILAMMDAGQVNRSHLHIVVLDPTRKPWDSRFEEAILYEYQIGDPGEWEWRYDEYARAKALVSWRTNLPAQLVQQRYPHFYVDLDTFLAGSAIYEGIIVACSGVEWFFDQMFAGMIAVACHSVGIELMQGEVLQVVHKTKFDYIGEGDTK